MLDAKAYVYISNIYKREYKKSIYFCKFFAVFDIFNIFFVFIIYFYTMADWDKLTDRGKIDDRRWGRVGKTLAWISIAGLLMTAGISYLAGEDPTKILLQAIQQAQESQLSSQEESTTWEFLGEDSYEVFVSTVLGSNNTLWQQYFSQNNLKYREPKLILFRGATSSACGGASSEHGPHYCPADETIYLDETFFDELTKNYWAQGGDVAEAYVIGHEVAHHVQHQLGLMKGRNIFDTQEAQNKNSIAIELQADCFAGIWASTVAGQGILEAWEIEEALDAASVVWDDHIQETVYGEIHPETWTHGSSAERKYWFMKWYQEQNAAACNTFEA